MILVIVPNISGHDNMIKRMVSFLTQKYSFLNFAEISIDYKNTKSLDPKIFSFQNAIDNVDNIVKKYKNQYIDLIISDYFAVEGFILSKIFDVPLINSCSATVDVSKWSIGEEYLKDFSKSDKYICQIQNRYEIKIPLPKRVSDRWFFEGDLNIIWNYLGNESLQEKVTYLLLGSPFTEVDSEKSVDDIEGLFLEERNVILVSLGTIAPLNEPRYAVEFFQKVIYSLENLYEEDRLKCSTVITCPSELHRFISIQPTKSHKIKLESWIDKEKLLRRTKLFIHHGDGSEFNEALSLDVPSIIIPFFGDQYDSLEVAKKYGVGTGFNKEELFSSDFIERLEKTIMRYIENSSKKNIIKVDKKIKSINIFLERFENLMRLDKLFRFHRGDLLFGTTKDRINFSSFYGVDINIDLINEHDRFVTPIEENFIPCLIDHWNNILRKYSEEQLKRIGTNICLKALEYKQYLKDSVLRIGIEEKIEDPLIAENTKLLKICCLGLEFFLKTTKCKIHLVIDRFSKDKNPGTNLEISYLKNLEEYKDRIIVWKYIKKTNKYIIAGFDYLLNLKKDYFPLRDVFDGYTKTIEEFQKMMSLKGVDFLIQKRIKDRNRFLEKIDNNLISSEHVEDLYGFRLVHFFTKGRCIITKELENRLGIKPIKGVDIDYFYLDQCEIQVCTMATFTGLSFNHDRIYKRKIFDKSYSIEDIKKRYSRQTELQKVIDNNFFLE